MPHHLRRGLRISRIVHSHAIPARARQFGYRGANAPAPSCYDQCPSGRLFLRVSHLPSLFPHRMECTLAAPMSIQERRSIRPQIMPSDTKSATLSKSEKRKNAWKSLPDVWALIKPRRGLLILGFGLMAINRVCGLVLPASTKYFVDNVAIKHQVYLLTPIVLAVLGATIVQG